MQGKETFKIMLTSSVIIMIESMNNIMVGNDKEINNNRMN